ncbi:hypothetical protein AB6N24_19830 [Cellulomonas sp. 179-A 4D5 NHS]|uniref:hypothetical protein n=1 Tax=Cellulomonas sp. 179-A 4D5 NHS TaxID=3142378 RepID=UPI00399F0321
MSADEARSTTRLPEQSRIVGEVARLVVAELDEPWDRAVLDFRALAHSAEHGLDIWRGGTVEEDFPPDATLRLLFELREVMYVPSAGTWFGVEIEITADGRTQTRFHHDDEPAWLLPPDDETYVDDLEKYPRDEENQPEWLRQKVARARAQSERELGPGDWVGLRFEASFTTDGQLSTELDFRPPPSAARWAEAVAGRLAERGIAARAGESIDDESGVTYPDVRVGLGTGYCSVAFWADEVFWSVDVAASQGDLGTVRRAATAVREVVQDVTGWRFVDARVTTAYERAMLGLPR